MFNKAPIAPIAPERGWISGIYEVNLQAAIKISAQYVEINQKLVKNVYVGERAFKQIAQKHRFLGSGPQNLDFLDQGEMFGLFRAVPRTYEDTFVN